MKPDNQEIRDRIISTAIDEFARLGYKNADIARLASAAGVSSATLYRYFDTKEKIFLAVIELGRDILNHMLLEMEQAQETQTLREIGGHMIRMIARSSGKYTKILQIYHSLTTEEMSPVALRFIDTFEKESKEFYIKLLRHGIQTGEVRADLDIDAAALVIDDLLMMLELAIGGSFHRERQKFYLGSNDVERHSAAVLEMIYRMVAPQPSAAPQSALLNRNEKH